MKKIKAVIIEDEEPAVNLLLNYLKGKDNIEIKAVCNDGFAGLKAVSEIKPDLIFLDVQMPKINGFEFLEVIDPVPNVIFTTAFDEYAVKAFDANAVDYLLKPFGKDRFLEALDKAIERINNKSDVALNVKSLITAKQNSNDPLNRIVVKKKSNIHIIDIEDIIYIEADGDYVKIHTETEKFLKENTMKFYEKKLNNTNFIRIHRSYILNVKFLDKIELFEKESYFVYLKNGKKIKASLSGYKLLKNRLNF